MQATPVEPPVEFVKPEAHVLVLGASDTGKSTFLRQMRLEFGDNFPPEERRRFIPNIRANVLSSMHKLVTAVISNELSYASQEIEDMALRFVDWLPLEVLAKAEEGLDPSWTDCILQLWSDPAIQMAYRRRSDIHLITNAMHFILNAGRILTENYTPSIDDIMFMRVITRSPVVQTYELKDIRMTLNDMGGQRPERRAWIQQINEPSAILFLASLSEYDQTVEEAEEDKNRVQESLDIFDELLSYAPFDRTPVILLLNKSDVFRNKIQEVPLRNFFPEYEGPEGDEIQGRDFIMSLYEKVSARHNRNFLVRYTEATNKENFLAIFSYVNNHVSRCIVGIGGLY